MFSGLLGENLSNISEWSAVLRDLVQPNFMNIFQTPAKVRAFPCGSAGKESACNAGDLGLSSEAAGETEAPGQQ